MALDKDRNRVLVSLRDRSEGADSTALVENLGLTKEVVERHLVYCADYALVAWNRHRNGSGRAMITTQGRDYLVRQGI